MAPFKLDTSVPELRKLFDSILEENRQVLRRKFDAIIDQSEEGSTDRQAFNLLLDEIGYIKTEQTFDRIVAAGNGSVAETPHLGSLARRAEKTPYAAPRAVEVALGGFFVGENWHGTEWDAYSHLSFRWSSDETGWVELRIDRHWPLVIHFECVALAPGARYEDLAIVVDDVVLETRSMPNPLGAHTTFFAQLPAAAEQSGSVHRFGIRCASPTRPVDQDPNSQDTRMLGAAITFFRVYPNDPVN